LLRLRTPVAGVLAAALMTCAFGTTSADASTGSFIVQQTRFDDLPGWAGDDHGAALSAFLMSCGKSAETGALGIPAAKLAALCDDARTASEADESAARTFFETSFTPFRLPQGGFLTGYYEPELDGSLAPSKDFTAPLLGPPDGLTSLDGVDRPASLDPDLTHALETDAGFVEPPDRGAIMDGALDGLGLERVWLKSRVDAFFVHVQGSARIRLADGSALRVGYAGKTGHPYTSIARVLVQRGEGSPESLTMAGLRRWLADHPDDVDELLRQNRSYIFFEKKPIDDPSIGPVGAAGTPLLAGRNLAMDRKLHTFGTPVFVTAALDVPLDGSQHLARLGIVADTGSAITGPGRADLFVGSGTEAGKIAGEIRNPSGMVLLVPNATAADFARRHR